MSKAHLDPTVRFDQAKSRGLYFTVELLQGERVRVDVLDVSRLLSDAQRSCSIGNVGALLQDTVRLVLIQKGDDGVDLG
jgi:hypothetical protein